MSDDVLLGYNEGPVVFVVTDSISVGFLTDQILLYSDRGHSVVVVSSPGQNLDRASELGAQVSVAGVPMHRAIRPLADLVSLVRLIVLFRRLRPAMVNASTPKAGLLGMTAAWITRVPARTYTVRGLRLQTVRGLNRIILGTTERVASGCAHRVVCVSESLRGEMIQRGLVRSGRAVVISEPGVDTEHFHPSAHGPLMAFNLRAGLSIPEGGSVIGYVGRLAHDKGIAQLLQVFGLVRDRIPGISLLIVGDPDLSDPITASEARQIHSDPGIWYVRRVKDPAPYYSALDVFVFPSLREGLGMAPIEAAASGVPVVAFAVTGVVDAVEDGVSGTLVAASDVDAMAMAVERYLADSALRERHGSAGRDRAVRLFSKSRVREAFDAEYNLVFSTGRRLRRRRLNRT